jgi:uncharacterized RDD family membrane protein YckC
MTASGKPQGDDSGLEQERIWAQPQPDPEPDEAASPAGLTSRLTSPARAPGPAGLLYADVPTRAMALILDIIVLSLVGFVLAWLLGGLVTEPGALDSAGGELDIVAFVVVLLLQLGLSVAYFAGFWSQLGQTPGMRLLGIRIGDEADGQGVSWRQALIRWLLLGLPALLTSLAVYVPNAIGLVLGALGVVWLLALVYTMAQSPSKQGLHDRSAHTILVKARRRSA